MKSTKIDWCDSSINLCVGCSNGCVYCYARKLNDRFNWIENWNEPQFFPKRALQLESKKGKSIFMDSMSDFGLWRPSWVVFVENAMYGNPQHAYIWLTKTNKYYHNWSVLKLPKPTNWYFGRSYTQGKVDPKGHYDFLSIEPLHDKVEILDFRNLRQVIIGAETGNRVGKIIPQKEWVLDLVRQCDEHNVRVFMKSSLCEIMGNDFRQDQLIWQDYLQIPTMENVKIEELEDEQR